MKKVSCASLAGWDCGWKSASKFQKQLSTQRLVGISSKPMCMRMRRNSARTLSRGWKLPPPTGSPMAEKLSGLKGVSLHVPLASMSEVMSEAMSTRVSAKRRPGATEKDLRFASDSSCRRLRFFASCAGMLPGSPPARCTLPSSSLVGSSATLAAARTRRWPWRRSHLFFMHGPCPTRTTSAPRAASSSAWEEPSPPGATAE
mmetsp:Transcript_12435/g.42036  ORF Transcript_12435/g.42036 Transcript_12435/m.42036 type:complete len:202 (-) Transcript_12435:273-878(-)